MHLSLDEIIFFSIVNSPALSCFLIGCLSGHHHNTYSQVTGNGIKCYTVHLSWMKSSFSQLCALLGYVASWASVCLAVMTTLTGRWSRTASNVTPCTFHGWNHLFLSCELSWATLPLGPASVSPSWRYPSWCLDLAVPRPGGGESYNRLFIILWINNNTEHQKKHHFFRATIPKI